MNFIIQQKKGICKLTPINVDVGTTDSEIIHACTHVSTVDYSILEFKHYKQVIFIQSWNFDQSFTVVTNPHQKI